MNIVVYLIQAVFSATMLINGATRYWGIFDRKAMEAIFYHYIPTKREERNWKLSQKMYGKYLMIAGLLNVVTAIVLIPVVEWLDTTGASDTISVGMLVIMFLPSFVYMFGAWGLMQLKLKQLEKRKN